MGRKQPGASPCLDPEIVTKEASTLQYNKIKILKGDNSTFAPRKALTVPFEKLYTLPPESLIYYASVSVPNVL